MSTVTIMGTSLFDPHHLGYGLAFAVAVTAAVTAVVLLPAFMYFAFRYKAHTGWLGVAVVAGPATVAAGAATAAGALAFGCPVGAVCCGVAALAGAVAAAVGVRRTRATRRVGRDGEVIRRMKVPAGVWCPGFREAAPGEQRCPVRLWHLGHRWNPGPSAERVPPDESL